MPNPGRSREIRVAVVLALGLLAFYGALLAWLPSRAVWGGDQGMKLLQIQALAGSPPRVSLDYAGASLAPEPRFAPYRGAHGVLRGDRWYSVFPIAHAALSALPFRVLGQPGVYVVPVVSVVASALLACALAGPLVGQREAIGTALLAALGSPLVFYGALLWEHAAAAAFATGALWCCARGGLVGAPGISSRWTLVGGALAGVTVWMRTEAYVFLAALALALWLATRRGASALRILVGGAIALVPLWLVNTFLYGDPLGAHLSFNLFAGGQPLAEGLSAFVGFRAAVARDLVPFGGDLWWVAFAAAASGAIALGLSGAPARRVGRMDLHRLGGIAVAAASLAAAAAGVVGIVRGEVVTSVLAACPWAVLIAGLAAPGDESDSATVRFLLAVCAAYAVGVVLLAPSASGVSWGGRLLLPVVPALAVLSVAGRARLLGAFRRSGALRMALAVATGAALLSGALVQVGGVRVLHAFKQRNLEFVQAVERSGERVFVSTARWPLLAAAPVWSDRVFLRADTHADFCTLLQRFAEAGIPRFTYLSVPRFVPDLSRGACPERAGYVVTGRTPMRSGSAITGVHYVRTRRGDEGEG